MPEGRRLDVGLVLGVRSEDHILSLSSSLIPPCCHMQLLNIWWFPNGQLLTALLP